MISDSVGYKQVRRNNFNFMRNKLVFILVIVTLLCSFAPIAFAQEVSQESTSTIYEIQALEKQINLLDRANSKILNTIYWALGGLITVFLAIVGLNFFQNFSLNKRKIETIKEEVDNEFKAAVSNLQEQNKKNLDSLNKLIESKIQSEVKASFDQLKSKLDKLKEDYGELNRENLIRKAFEYKEKHRMGYILNLVSVLEYDIKKGWVWRINESLDLISKCLDSFSPDYDSLTRLQVTLSKLSSEYSVQKKHIESKMKL